MSRPRALIVTGGLYHDHPEMGGALARLTEAAGFASEAVHGAAAGLERFTDTGADLLILSTLAWSMGQNTKYAPWRAQYAYDIPAPVRAAITAHLQGGGGLLGLHTAAICFDDWPEWGGMLGARWVWGRSHHPTPGPVSVTLAPGDHPLTRGLPGFALQDELYCALDIAADAQVLAHATATGVETPQPVLTVRQEGPARVVYSALGHDPASLALPAHGALLTRAARWAGGLI